MPLLAAVKSGVGSTLSEIALVICLGAILEKSWNATVLPDRSPNPDPGFGKKISSGRCCSTGFLVGIPLFYNTGFIILVPLIFSIAPSGPSLVYIAIPLAAGLFDDPLFSAATPRLRPGRRLSCTDLGKTLIYGLIIALPVVIIAGPMLGKMLRKWFGSPSAGEMWPKTVTRSYGRSRSFVPGPSSPHRCVRNRLFHTLPVILRTVLLFWGRNRCPAAGSLPWPYCFSGCARPFDETNDGLAQ